MTFERLIKNATSLLVPFGLLISSVACGNRVRVQESAIISSSEMVSISGVQKITNHSIGLNDEEVRQLLAEHNRVRSTVGVGSVIWSPDLAAYAQQWADHLAANECRIKHRPEEGKWQGIYGENLFTGTAGYYDVTDGVRAWESEKQFFKGGAVTLTNVQQVGHYTQLVWRGTTQVGCGKAECRGKIILVCNYSPPGNVVDEAPY